MRLVGQAHGEGQPQHPDDDVWDPLTDTFSLAAYLNVLPSILMDEDDELLVLYTQYLNGLERGREIARGRP